MTVVSRDRAMHICGSREKAVGLFPIPVAWNLNASSSKWDNGEGIYIIPVL